MSKQQRLRQHTQSPQVQEATPETVQPPQAPNSAEAADEPGGCLSAMVRLSWMVAGSMGWFLTLLFIAQRASYLADIVFFGLVAGMIVVRYIDINRFAGQTVDGTPATLRDWKDYAIGLSLISLVAWGVARVSAFYGWM